MGFQHVSLTEGVVGGFVPAVKRLEITIAGNDVTLLKLNTKTFHPKPEDYSQLKGQLDAAHVAQIDSEIQKLWGLPTEDPPGSEDVYHQDTSLVVTGADGKTWGNYAPQGCVHTESTGQPTQQQIEVFKGIVAVIKQVATSVCK